MPVILAIETATKVCSAALFDESRLIAFKEEDGEYRHAEKLNVFIDEVMKGAGMKLSNVDAIAVGKGPGSYTGLRIGVSSAKGLCYALSKPLISVNSLYTMAAGAKQHLQDMGTKDNFVLCPMIDARRMEVYTAIYDHNLNLMRETAADIIDRSDFYSEYAKNSTFYYFGDGAAKCREMFENETNMQFLSLQDPVPSARFIGKIALEKYQSRQFEDTAYFEPFYLKDFITTTPKKQIIK